MANVESVFIYNELTQRRSDMSTSAGMDSFVL